MQCLLVLESLPSIQGYTDEYNDENNVNDTYDETPSKADIPTTGPDQIIDKISSLQTKFTCFSVAFIYAKKTLLILKRCIVNGLIYLETGGN